MRCPPIPIYAQSHAFRGGPSVAFSAAATSTAPRSIRLFQGLSKSFRSATLTTVTDQVDWHDAGFQMEAVAISVERGVVPQ